MIKPYYQDSAVTLYHGLCHEMLSQFDAVGHVITDPPYARDVYLRASMPCTKEGSGTPARLGVGALAKLAAGDIGSIDEILDDVAFQIARITQRWAIVFSDVETCSRWRKSLSAKRFGRSGEVEHEGMRYVRTGAWVKPNTMPQMSGDRPAVGFEPCTIAHAQGPMRWNGGGHAAVWTYGTVNGIKRPDHPCPKPEQLMADLVTQFTDPDELILDPFGGSGTTAVAAKRLGRRCILIEKEEKYCEVAAKRLAQGALNLFGEHTA